MGTRVPQRARRFAPIEQSSALLTPKRGLMDLVALTMTMTRTKEEIMARLPSAAWTALTNPTGLSILAARKMVGLQLAPPGREGSRGHDQL